MSTPHPTRPTVRLSIEKLEDRVNPDGGYVNGVVLVGLTPGQEASAITQMTGTGFYGGSKHLGFGIYKVTLGPGVAVNNAVTRFTGLPGVRYAEPDYIEQTFRMPNDPMFQSGDMWGLHNTGQNGGTADADIDAPEAWDLGTGSNRIVVAVIDSGVDYTHPDLAANIWRNPAETPGDGVDNDGNGFIDDTMGWDFVGDDNNPDPEGDGHGTHVAGTIGAVGNNGIGVTGVAWGPQIMVLRTINGSQGGAVSASIAAINYATANGAKITNNSYGGSTFSQARQDAILAAAQGGVIFVAAAGNETNDNDANPRYPVGHISPNVVGVAATDRNDQLAGFSNYGRTTVMVAAPGDEIMSTLPGGQYGNQSGTSMASPMVAGALAAFWDANPFLTYTEVIAAMGRSVDRLPSLAGRVITGGRINLGKLMLEGGTNIYATGADQGGGPHVKVYRGAGGLVAQFMAYDPAFTGGVRVATGDVTGDRTADIVTVAGPGGGPHVKVFDGKTFQEVAGFYAFEAAFTGGLTVATGDVNGDGVLDVIVGADKGGGPRVSVFSRLTAGGAFTRIADFFAYDPAFRGGVQVAAGVFNAGSKQADVVTAPGRGGGPHVRRFSSAALMGGRVTVAAEAMVGDPADRSGLFVATGDFNGDGLADILTGAGSDGSVVRINSGATMAPLAVLRNPFGGEMPGLLNPADPLFATAFYAPNAATNLLPPATPPTSQINTTPLSKPGGLVGYMFGARVAAQDVTGDKVADIIVAGGPNDAPTLAIINGADLSVVRSFNAYDPSFSGGVFVGGAGV